MLGVGNEFEPGTYNFACFIEPFHGSITGYGSPEGVYGRTDVVEDNGSFYINRVENRNLDGAAIDTAKLVGCRNGYGLAAHAFEVVGGSQGIVFEGISRGPDVGQDIAGAVIVGYAQHYFFVRTYCSCRSV